MTILFLRMLLQAPQYASAAASVLSAAAIMRQVARGRAGSAASPEPVGIGKKLTDDVGQADLYAS